MLTLTMKNDLEFRLNLKSFEEEKQFYYKWYSMSDMPGYSKTIIAFETIRNETAKYMVSDIKNCKFEEIIYDRDLQEKINNITEDLLTNALNSLIK